MQDVQALCDRLVLIFDGQKGFDGPLGSFENILGNEKVVSFTFSEAQTEAPTEFKDYKPQWNEDRTQVELRVCEEDLRTLSSKIIADLPVTEFATDKMPIERVMKELMNNPELLRSQIAHE